MNRSGRSLGRSLTLRGKGLLAVGLGLGLGAALSGQRDLLRVAVLLLALPLLAYLVVGRRALRLGFRRTVAPRRVPAGEDARVDLAVRNLAGHRSRPLQLRDRVPVDLGVSPRLLMPATEAGGERVAAYGIRTRRRGRFEIGPLTVGAMDPFGLVRVTHAFATTEPLLVVPPTIDLPAGLLGADHRGRGDMESAALASRGSDDLVPREYRIGDDLRRIHWRATARTDELMVRREEQPLTRRATVLVDLREEVQWGEGPASTVEIALSAAASIAIHLLRTGWRVRVTGVDGLPLAPLLSGSAGEAMLLDVLATVSTAPGIHVSPAAVRSDCAIVVAAPDPELTDVLTQAARGPADLGVAVLVPGGRGPGRPEEAPARLRAASWRVGAVERLTDLPGAWAGALSPAAAGPAPAPATLAPASPGAPA